MTAHGRSAFLGRTQERAHLAGLLDDLRDGRSAALVVRGEAGIGKTALLHEVARAASGVRVARIAGVESEVDLPFAGLHQLCAPMLEHLDAVPAPQQVALRVALGLAPGNPPDRFLVALAALTLLAEAAVEQPLLCIVDDAQWLDSASSQVLGFVARRLVAESVALVFAVRSPFEHQGLRRLPQLHLEGLSEKDARALLTSVIPGRIDERVRDRILAEVRGNPLALLELPRGLSTARLAGGFGLLEPVQLSGLIEDSFLQRLDEVPPAARLLLLVAAAEPLGDPMLLWGAAERLGIGGTALEPAERAGMLQVGARVRFRHPLVRSAVYRSASASERRIVHRALAETTDADAEPDRHAWHRAQAADGPDEGVAAELERSAGRAQARGGLAAAAAFWQRAADLSVDPTRRAERTVAAAQAHLHAGAFDAALAMLAQAEAGPLDDLGRARVDLLHAGVAYAQNRDGDAPPLLLRAARRLETLDVRLSRDTYLDAWGAALFAGHLARNGGLLEVSQAVAGAPRATGAPRPSDELLDGFALVFTEGRPVASPALQRAAKAFASGGASAEEVLRWGWLATAAAVYVWDFDTCLAAARRGVDLARSSGALEVLAVSVNVLGQAVALGGDFESASHLIAEADAVREATGTRVAPYGALVLAALRGHEADDSALIEATIVEATAGGQGTAVQYARWAKAVLMNGLGRHDEALDAAVAASEDVPELFVAMWSLSEAIEAAHRTGDDAASTRALALLREHTRGSDSPWALGLEARGGALLADGEEAAQLYREAIEHLGRTRLRPELARARLLYGEWLRRTGQHVAASEELRDACDAFVAMGADAFAGRARRELAATGERVSGRGAEPRGRLTPREQHIARLARDRRTNVEIAAQLVLSPRTVEWHLKSVFSKLGVSSRRELDSVLPRPAEEGDRPSS